MGSFLERFRNGGNRKASTGKSVDAGEDLSSEGLQRLMKKRQEDTQKEADNKRRAEEEAKRRQEKESIERSVKWFQEAVVKVLKELTENGPALMKEEVLKGKREKTVEIYKIYDEGGPVDGDIDSSNRASTYSDQWDWTFYRWYYKKSPGTLGEPVKFDSKHLTSMVAMFARTLSEYQGFVDVCKKMNYRFSFEIGRFEHGWPSSSQSYVSPSYCHSVALKLTF